MNTQTHTRTTADFKASNVHAIPEGSKPSERILPGPDGYYMAMPINTLERTPEQKLVAFNREYERAVAFYYAACDAQGAASGHEANEKAETVVDHANRILQEIAQSAYAVPTRTVREVALKARIMSYAKGSLWENTEDEQDADVRFVIEDVLALGGLDRLRRRDFAFNDLLPSYNGPARHETASALEPTKEAAHSAIHALGLEAQTLWDLDTRIEDRAMWDTSTPTMFESDRRQVSDRISSIEAQITYMQPTTLADLMVQLALIHDNLDAMGREKCKLDEAISRMVTSALLMLCNMTGLSLKDAGVEAYAKNLVQFGTMSLADRLDPDRFERNRARWRQEDANNCAPAAERAA